MKKRVWFPFAVLLIFLLTAVSVCASDEAPPLSPAIRILAGRASAVKTGVVGETVSFSAEDFEKSLGYVPTEITIESLPETASGILKVGTLDLLAGQTLSASAVSALRFQPASADSPVTAAFSFTAKGKSYETDVARMCTLYILPEENQTPTADTVSCMTYTDTPIGSTLRGNDPDGNPLTYTLVKAPKKGTAELDETTGKFLYTPAEGKTGRDSFTYRVSDPYGAESAVTEVTLTIRKNKTDVVYEDMKTHWAACAAIAVTEADIMTGKQCGDVMCFVPDEAVTRGDFLMMAMKAAEIAPDTVLQKTVFTDDGEIPDYMRPYVTAAYRAGYLTGSTEEGKTTVSFLPEQIITRAEAAVLLDRILGLSDDVLSVFAEDTEDAAIPAWSRSAVSALSAAGILNGTDNGFDGTTALDRAQTAQMLMRVKSYCENR